MTQQRAVERQDARQASGATYWTREDFSKHAAPCTAPLFRLCLAMCRSREEAEDLLQNALVKAFVHRASYRGDAPFQAWLYGIVRNERAEMVRRAARRGSLWRNAIEHLFVVCDDLLQHPESPENSCIQTEDANMVVAVVRELPEPFREVVWMSDIEEMSYDEISQALSIPAGTVKSRHSRGRVRLRALLESRREREAQ